LRGFLSVFVWLGILKFTNRRARAVSRAEGVWSALKPPETM